MIVFDFLKNLQKIIVLIEDVNWDSIVGTMFPSSDISSTSAINVDINNKPNTSEEGSRSITANIQSDDPLERILANAIEAYTLSLRLQRSGQDVVPINRSNLIRYIRTINNRIGEVVDWYDDCLASDKTDDYKVAVKNAYQKCVDAITNFNQYVIDINSGKSDIIWAQPDVITRIPSITPLPPR